MNIKWNFLILALLATSSIGSIGIFIAEKAGLEYWLQSLFFAELWGSVSLKRRNCVKQGSYNIKNSLTDSEFFVNYFKVSILFHFHQDFGHAMDISKFPFGLPPSLTRF